MPIVEDVQICTGAAIGEPSLAFPAEDWRRGFASIRSSVAMAGYDEFARQRAARVAAPPVPALDIAHYCDCVGPMLCLDEPLATVTIERFADGTFSVFVPLPGGRALGLARGDLDGAMAFAREQIQLHGR